ncbi:hypothetical protein SAMN05421734_10669 [Pelagirhabdus alkalitolerans]|uniref:Uncharacterized protein n=1 Tax=Pelagirhabdus alkalitolerans TaxID=1612202 RepID=A0A1G6KEM9_9BACI|nr:hypothetical protein SAMN05421734_10669 [Pelagirhabdus alkalitolerans]
MEKQNPDEKLNNLLDHDELEQYCFHNHTEITEDGEYVFFNSCLSVIIHR